MYPAIYARLILLAASSYSSHLAYTSPNPAPKAEEQAKYKTQPTSSLGERGFTAVHAVSCLKVCLPLFSALRTHLCSNQTFVHIINVIELITLLFHADIHTAHKLPLWLSVDLAVDLVPSAIFVGTLLMCMGTVLRVLSYRYLGRCFTFELAIKKDHKLVTDGPYAVVRHPSYTGAWLFNLGVAISLLGPGSAYTELGLWTHPLGLVIGIAQLGIIAYIGITIALRVQKEDMALKAEFRDQWSTWARKTPCRLIPHVY